MIRSLCLSWMLMRGGGAEETGKAQGKAQGSGIPEIDCSLQTWGLAFFQETYYSLCFGSLQPICSLYHLCCPITTHGRLRGWNGTMCVCTQWGASTIVVLNWWGCSASASNQPVMLGMSFTYGFLLDFSLGSNLEKRKTLTRCNFPASAMTQRKGKTLRFQCCYVPGFL